MTNTSSPLQHLSLTMLIVGSVFVAPLASVGHSLSNGAHFICIDMMESCELSYCPAADKVQYCCDAELSYVLQQGKSESNPRPFDDLDDCCCCVTMSYSTILWMICQSEESHIEKIIHVIAAIVQTPTCARWYDPLLRPPIG